jgi:hypothetical protein
MIGCGAMTCARAAPGPLPADDTGIQGSDVFMKAVRYALTGWDRANVTAEDGNNCVFREIDPTRPKDQLIFYLNSVDRRRLKFRARQQLFADAWVPLVDITLAGAQPVYEYRPAKGSPQTGFKTDRYKLTIYGAEDFPRLVRAWKFIYAHGCLGAESSSGR